MLDFPTIALHLPSGLHHGILSRKDRHMALKLLFVDVGTHEAQEYQALAAE